VTARQDDVGARDRHSERWSGARLAAGLGLLGLATFVVAWGPWHGPILLTIARDHGVDAGDLIVLPLVLVAAGLLGRVLWPGPEHRHHLQVRRRLGLAAATGGVLLLFFGLTRLLDLGGLGPLDATTTPLLALAGLWLLIEIELLADHRPPALLGCAAPVAALAAGSVIDLVVVPTGTVFGVAALTAAVSVVIWHRSRWLAGLLILLSLGSLVVSIASLTDRYGIDVRMATDEGGAARSAALGAACVVIGVGLAAGHVGRSTASRAATTHDPS
jgi:hypothetical protein